MIAKIISLIMLGLMLFGISLMVIPATAIVVGVVWDWIKNIVV